MNPVSHFPQNSITRIPLFLLTLIFSALCMIIPGIAYEKPAVDLGFHEKQGGHTIERHVGKTDQDLINRLKNNRRISAASTFVTLADAEAAVADAIAKNYGKIMKWQKKAKKRDRLVVKGKGRGKGISRRDFNKAMKQKNPNKALKSAVKPRSRCRAVLQADGKGRYFVLTAYPE